MALTSDPYVDLSIIKDLDTDSFLNLSQVENKYIWKLYDDVTLWEKHLKRLCLPKLTEAKIQEISQITSSTTLYWNIQAIPKGPENMSHVSDIHRLSVIHGIRNNQYVYWPEYKLTGNINSIYISLRSGGVTSLIIDGKRKRLTKKLIIERCIDPLTDEGKHRLANIINSEYMEDRCIDFEKESLTGGSSISVIDPGPMLNPYEIVIFKPHIILHIEDVKGKIDADDQRGFTRLELLNKIIRGVKKVASLPENSGVYKLNKLDIDCLKHQFKDEYQLVINTIN